MSSTLMTPNQMWQAPFTVEVQTGLMMAWWMATDLKARTIWSSRRFRRLITRPDSIAADAAVLAIKIKVRRIRVRDTGSKMEGGVYRLAKQSDLALIVMQHPAASHLFVHFVEHPINPEYHIVRF